MVLQTLDAVERQRQWKEQELVEVASVLAGVASQLAELRVWAESHEGRSALLSDADMRSELRAVIEDLGHRLESARGTIPGILGPHLPKLRVRCPLCGTTIVSLWPPYSFAVESEPVISTLGPVDERHWGSRIADVSPPGQYRSRVRFVCPRKRCDRAVTVSMGVLVEHFVTAANAGRHEVRLDF